MLFQPDDRPPERVDASEELLSAAQLVDIYRRQPEVLRLDRYQLYVYHCDGVPTRVVAFPLEEPDA